ncbi:MAG TPA: hypothetical protein VFA44_08565 [Gaiellaceae bacterium]|nr:hypothetical protein [Gaiellaceae bacterium]
MSDSLHIVFSSPPDGVPEDEFNRWYDAHLDEILAVPGFVSARRFRLDPIVSEPGAGAPFRYLAVYEIDGDPADAIAELERAGFGSKESYAALKDADSGSLELPRWWNEARFASWNCVALGARVERRD